MTAWFPNEYVDEIMPPDRDSADAWVVKLADGGYGLAPLQEGDRDRPLVHGEVVGFSMRMDHGNAMLTIDGDWSWSVSSPMPPQAQLVCALNGWQTETLSGSVAEVVKNLREFEAGPGEYLLSYYTFSDVALRFDAEKGLFEEVGAIH